MKAMHAQEDKEAVLKKAADVCEKLEDPGLKLPQVADRVRERLEEVFGYMAFPSEHWKRIRSNSLLERAYKEVRRQTRVVGTFPDGRRAWMLVSTRLREVASREWVMRRYTNMEHLRALDLEAAEAAVHILETAGAVDAPHAEAAWPRRAWGGWAAVGAVAPPDGHAQHAPSSLARRPLPQRAKLNGHNPPGSAAT